MGLLDEAIKEHLDLKRKRGADPGEIERLERDALGPVRRGAGVAEYEEESHFEADAQHEPAETYADADYEDVHGEPYPRTARDQPDRQPQPTPKRGFLRRRRRAVPLADSAPTDVTDDLEADADDPFAHYDDPPVAPAGATTETEPPPPSFDSPPPRPHFSAEPPGPSDPHGSTEAQSATDVEPQTEEHAVAPTDEPEPDATHEWDVEGAFEADDVSQPEPQGTDQASDEDVLEETPEFLQDTPEHDRLWFEQRPPRDFDFDG
ncbi:MAG: hypothetical protein ACRDKL_00010 [Solirubrobacteraceae bacterium]